MAFPSCCTLLTACCFVGDLHSWRAHCELFKVDLIYTHQEEYRFGFLDDQYLHKENIQIFMHWGTAISFVLGLFFVLFFFCSLTLHQPHAVALYQSNISSLSQWPSHPKHLLMKTRVKLANLWHCDWQPGWEIFVSDHVVRICRDSEHPTASPGVN